MIPDPNFKGKEGDGARSEKELPASVQILCLFCPPLSSPNFFPLSEMCLRKDGFPILTLIHLLPPLSAKDLQRINVKIQDLISSLSIDSCPT